MASKVYQSDEELLRQALEALEQVATDIPWDLTALQADTIDALRERLGGGGEATLRASGWQEGEDPTTEGLYVVRDSRGNAEVGMWYEKTFDGRPAEWTRELRDVDRDDIVAWIKIPPYGRAD